MRDAYVGLAHTLFEGPAQRLAARDQKLRLTLEQAHIPLLPTTFFAVAWTSAVAAALAAALALAGGFAIVVAAGLAMPTPAILAVLAVLPIMAGAGTYVAILVYPDYRAGERRRAIEADLPYAINYIAAMSAAGVVPAEVFRDLGRQPIYGEVAREFAWIARDLDLFGGDFLTSINRAMARTPSRRLADFLQGAKTTILAGGDLKAYFQTKAEQFMIENRRVQKEFLDGLGIMAESYVTVVIAGPLFMLVLLSVMIVIGSSTLTAEMFLFALVFLLLPASHAAFTWIVRSMAPEV